MKNSLTAGLALCLLAAISLPLAALLARYQDKIVAAFEARGCGRG